MLHENRKYCRGGGVAVFVQESLYCTKRNDLYINCEAIESLSIEISNSVVKNIIFNVVYCPPDVICSKNTTESLDECRRVQTGVDESLDEPRQM